MPSSGCNPQSPHPRNGSWWLDATSCSRSANNSGIQRVVRGLYRNLVGATPVTPLAWNDSLQCFATPTKREFQFLTDPFGEHSGSRENPNQSSAGDWLHWGKSLWHHGRHKVNWETETPRGLLLPEVFRDSRLLALPRPAELPFPVIAWFHDACALELKSVAPPAKVRRFERYLRYLSECSQIITISEHSKKALIHWCRANHTRVPPITVIPLPVQFDHPRVSEVGKPAKDRPVVLFVSSLTYNKNHLGLLESAERLWQQGVDFELELVGKVDRAWREKVLPVIQRLEKEKYPLRWLKHISDEELVEVYREADFTVYPSLCEGYGLPILESLWFAKPCLIPEMGAMAEVGHSGGGCASYDPTSPRGLDEGLRSLIQNPDRCTHLSQLATERKFPSWSEYRTQLLNILKG